MISVYLPCKFQTNYLMWPSISFVVTRAPHAVALCLHFWLLLGKIGGCIKDLRVMGPLRWSIIYYHTQLSAEWQMSVREMGPERSELGYWPQLPLSHYTLMQADYSVMLSSIIGVCWLLSIPVWRLSCHFPPWHLYFHCSMMQLGQEPLLFCQSVKIKWNFPTLW